MGWAAFFWGATFEQCLAGWLTGSFSLLMVLRGIFGRDTSFGDGTPNRLANLINALIGAFVLCGAIGLVSGWGSYWPMIEAFALP